MFDSIIKKCDESFDHAGELISDLGLNNLLYSKDLNLVEYISTDEVVIRERNHVINDLVSIPELHAVLLSVIDDLRYIKNMVNIREAHYAAETHLYSVKQLEIYFHCIDTITQNSEHFNNATSDSIRAFYSEVVQMAESDEYRKLREGTKELLKKIGSIRSISLGFNFNEDLSLKDGGILSINTTPIVSKTLIERLLSVQDANALHSMAPLTTPKVLNRHESSLMNDTIYTALNKWFKKNLSQWQPTVDAFLSNSCKELLEALPVLIFLTESVKIHRFLTELRLPLCKPIIHPTGEKVFSVKNAYNPVTALQVGAAKIVKNDFSFDEKGQFYILTGPNQGGKSVFLRCVGIIQVFAQLGWLVPAESASISPVLGLYTHFPKSVGESGNGMGRLEEECHRLSAIVEKLSPHSMLLLDETLSSTNAYEATYIACDFIRGVTDIGCRGIFSTHLHEVVEVTERYNAQANSRSVIDYLKVGIYHDRRTYKVYREKSDGKSYAQDIAKRYGLTYDQIKSVWK